MAWFMLILACNVWSLNVSNRDIETSTQELLCTTNLTLCSKFHLASISVCIPFMRLNYDFLHMLLLQGITFIHNTFHTRTEIQPITTNRHTCIPKDMCK